MIKLFTHKIGGAKKIFTLALLLGVAFAQQAIADTVEPSTTMPDQGMPENLYTMQCGNDYSTGVPAYVAKTLYPTKTQSESARFAFYAVDGKTDTYQIYCYDAQKWLTYTATSSFSTGKDMITLSTSQVSNTYFKVTQLTSGSYAGTYEIQPYTTSGTTTGYYVNYFGGLGVNMNDDNTSGWHTLGLWTDDGNQDKGSHWTFHNVSKAVITNTVPQVGSCKTIKSNYKATKNQAWEESVGIDWDTQKLVVKVNLTGVYAADGSSSHAVLGVCSNDVTIGWNTNCSITYNEGANIVRGYVPNTNGNDNNYNNTQWSTDPVVFEYAKAYGLKVNGEQKSSATLLSDLFDASIIKVGSTNTAASGTYTIEVQSLDYAPSTTSQSNTIQEDKKNTFSAQNEVNVSLARTLSHDYWNTFCVPFAVSSDKVNEVFGANCEIREYNSMDGTTMNFKSASSIEAGKPYLIKPAADVTNPTFKGVSIVAGDPVTVPADGTYQMKGTYGLTDLATDGTNLFLGDQDKFYVPSASGKTMKGMRAYFIVPSGTNAKAMRANIDGNVTAISNINGAEVVSVAPVYNLQGQYVGTSLNGLQRGIYVQNGKKIIVR